MRKEFAIALPEHLNEQLLAHLIRDDGDEDLIFALWTPSYGRDRKTALINKLIFPKDGERQRHGNVSFNPPYYKRVCREAMAEGMGVCFIHSHPFPGWQGMSSDDIAAETRMASSSFTLTDLPLIGMTVGNDGTWSGRIWEHNGNGMFERLWADLVKSVGNSVKVSFNRKTMPEPKYQDMFKRTRTVYGKEKHEDMCRMRVGIVGLGSVGSIVAETLARMGLEKIVLIDFDKAEPHNLDRLLGASQKDIGIYKVEIAERQMKLASTASNITITAVPKKLSDSEGYAAALSCDILFSCVDRPWPRHILNHLAYSHLIPVIDGGIRVSFKDGLFQKADWQFQTATPGRPCLQCLKVYESSDVELEKAGMLENKSYLDGLDDHHPLKHNENIFPFSAHLASFEIFHFIALITGIGGINDFGVQRFRYTPGHLSTYEGLKCMAGCTFHSLQASGDKYISGV